MDFKDYQLVHKTECSDGFGVQILVRRPPETVQAVDNLDDTPRPDHSLTPKELANTMFLRVGGQIYDMLRLQAVELDPKIPESIAKTKKEFLDAFTSAGLGTIYVEVIPNEYCGRDLVEAFCAPWYNITTRLGHFKIGWRRRVILLDWERSTVKQSGQELFPNEDVTKGDKMIHVYGYKKLAEYVKKIADSNP